MKGCQHDQTIMEDECNCIVTPNWVHTPRTIIIPQEAEWRKWPIDEGEGCSCDGTCNDSCSIEVDSLIEGLTHLQALDALNDLRLGVDHWRETKVASGNWDIHDEMLARYVDAAPDEQDPPVAL